MCCHVNQIKPRRHNLFKAFHWCGSFVIFAQAFFVTTAIDDLLHSKGLQCCGSQAMTGNMLGKKWLALSTPRSWQSHDPSLGRRCLLLPSWVRLTVHAHPLLRDQVLPIETTVSHSVALLDSLDSDNDSDLQNNASSNAASFLLDFLLVSTWSSFVCLYMTRLPEI